jgi:hypothetical protein
MKIAAALLSFTVVLSAVPAAAQDDPLPSTAYRLGDMNFDMWCQEQKHYPPERCDKRLPKDDAEFKAFRSTVQTYELERLKQQRQGQELDRTILRNDPVDKRTNPAAGLPGSLPDPQ